VTVLLPAADGYYRDPEVVKAATEVLRALFAGPAVPVGEVCRHCAGPVMDPEVGCPSCRHEPVRWFGPSVEEDFGW
jgi:hypothetical protein